MQLTSIKIKNAIQDIANNLIAKEDLTYGLLDGISGITLFYAFTSKYSTATNAFVSLQECFDLASEKFSLTSNHDTSLCYGLAGYAWHLNELARIELIELDNELSELLNFSRQQITSSILNDIDNNNIDFLAGAIGKISYLFPFFECEISIVQKFVNYLFGQIVNNSLSLFSLSYRDSYRSSRHLPLNVKYVNMGLAHGLPGILQFCALCKKNGLFIDKIDVIGHVCFDFFLKNINQDTSLCYYPSFIQTELYDQPRENSRLAWCYGDLSIAYTLLLSGEAFQNTAIQELAGKILLHCTNRRIYENSYVVDAGFCHGSSGVAHLFHKVWNFTKNPLFYDTAEFWINKTLDFAVTENGCILYKQFDSRKKQFCTEFNLLTGMAGIGLVLNSWLTGDCSWDSCLMLNP